MGMILHLLLFFGNSQNRRLLLLNGLLNFVEIISAFVFLIVKVESAVK